MGVEQVEVHELVMRAVEKKVDIPEFQREFVWSREQVKLLAESLYREYPIGSLLLWDSSEYQEAKVSKGTQISLWIIDGQQRITALCLLFGMKPYWWESAEEWNEALDRYDVMVNVLPSKEENELEFALPNPIRRRDPRWISIRSILSKEKVEELTPIAHEISVKIGKGSNKIMEIFQKVHARLQRIWQIRHRDIPVITVRHEVEDVAEIFARLNQAGTRIKEADVTLALAAVRNPGWVREQYLPFRNDLEERGWDLSAGIFIRTMAAIGSGRARLKEVPKDLWGPDKLPNVWRKASSTISEVLKRLAEFGITSPDILPSVNSLIPLFALYHRWKNSDDFSFKKALYWFLLANWDGRYSGSAITTLNEDIKTITDSKTFTEVVEKLLQRLQVPAKLERKDFLERYDRAGNRFLRLILWLVLYRRNAVDWVDRTRLGYDKTGSPITTGFQPQWHHIFPRSVLRRAGVKDDEIHALANITVMNERTNVKKLSSLKPWQYIRKYSIPSDALHKHLIPSEFINNVDEESWAIKRYPEFLVRRAELLARNANLLLQDLRGELI
ncbi:hypothetical protein DRO64_09740 [Candidatus Bathyarchaeota archaeon]|nr:MAG: hypothetical protein DRO64_09740 [Candidatus Bathyarchaeota archaeon]